MYRHYNVRRVNYFRDFACCLFQKLDDLLRTVNDRKRKQNGQFIRNKCKNKRRRVSSAEHETRAENIADTSDGTELPEQTPEREKYSWRDG